MRNISISGIARPEINPQSFISQYKSLSLFSMLVIAVLIFISGCTSMKVAFYDATTYTNLTSLKAESMMLVESFDNKPLDENSTKIEKLNLSIRKAYEYEKGKGNINRDTLKQMKKIIGLFNSDIEHY